MRAIEKLGITREVYEEIYTENKGFNNHFNKNHASHEENETFLDFLYKGSKSLVKERGELVSDIINEDIINED